MAVSIFQSTLPRGERLRSEETSIRYTRFQSTLPRGERRLPADLDAYVDQQFQSTLPRGERLTFSLIPVILE